MIDLRSDTVTRPGPAMRQAMAEAEVGDDVWGDDPTVIALERQTAELLGHESAMFVPSGTQSNLCALMSHCGRGDEYIVGQNAHTYKYEAGGAAVLGSIQPQPLDLQPDGTLDLDQVRAAIKPDDPHFARTRLLAIENTHDGMTLPMDYIVQARDLAYDNGLSFHLDGARVWNAAAALDIDVAEITELFDTVSVCLSKGLGAPVGSVLVGPEAFITRARRARKMLGGSMRQAGVLAAAGLYALDHNRDRLKDDHALAAHIGEVLGTVDGVEVEMVNTNMVFANFDAFGVEAAQNRFDDAGILAAIHPGLSRLVTHLDVTPHAPAEIARAFDNL